jgi:hypothetical protein
VIAVSLRTSTKFQQNTSSAAIVAARQSKTTKSKRRTDPMSCKLEDTQGRKVNLIFTEGGRPVTFTAGGRKRHDFGDGQVIVNGLVKLNDGTRCAALLEIDESSSGEHGGTGIFYIDKEGLCNIVFQGDEGFPELLGKTKKEVFPYTYKYARGTVHCNDIHIGEDGWS